MKNRYRVYYTIVTHSRCGSYLYDASEKFEAESPEEAESLLKHQILDNKGNRRFRLVIRGVKKIEPKPAT